MIDKSTQIGMLNGGNTLDDKNVVVNEICL